MSPIPKTYGEDIPQEVYDIAAQIIRFVESLGEKYPREAGGKTENE